MTAIEAHAAVTAERDRHGGTRLVTLRSDPPLTLRATGPGAVHLVGSAAGPVGGDALRLDVRVGPAARLHLSSVAAALVLPGPSGRPSATDVVVDIGDGGALRWTPQPTVLVRGCDHVATTTVRLGTGAELVWREAVVLGRHDEPPGSVLQRLRVDRGGSALARNDLAVGPRWPGSLGPAGVGDARAVASALVVGPDAATQAWTPPGDGGDGRVATFLLADDAVLAMAVAATAMAAISLVDAALGGGADPTRR